MRPLDFMKPFVILLAFVALPLYASSRPFPQYFQQDTLSLLYESLYLTNQATKLINKGDTKTAAALLLRAMPDNFKNPN